MGESFLSERFRGWTRFLLAVLLIFTVGCGSGSGTDAATSSSTSGNNNNTSTGSLTFLFTQSQAASVPASTATLIFEFTNDIEAVIFTTEIPYATSVVIDGVPTSAVAVKITAVDGTGVPLATLDQQVTVVPDTITPVDLSSATVTPVTVESVSVTPSPVDVGAGETVTLTGSATFSDGSTVSLGASSFTFSSANTGIATVDGSGVVTGVAVGTTTVEVGLVSDSSQTASVTINVAGFEFQVFGNQNLPIAGGDGLTSGNYRPVFIDASGAQTVLDPNDTNLELALDTTFTGLSITTVIIANDTRIQITASGTDASPGDSFTLVGRYTAPNGVVVSGSLLITVTQLP